MALPPHFLDELRARTPMSALVSRRVKLARSGRQWKGCCPFHGEKSPSFYVYEDGYHCFGCGAHGDAISFVMQTQGSGFMEAVQSLAGEAGLDVPKATPEAAEAERRRLDLHGVLDAACAAYRRRLRTPDGAGALAYLLGRGLSEATIEAFGLGWSGEGRGALAAELAPQGVTPEQLLQAGLLRETEDGGRARELFYNRVMFPIRDRTGRIISFGGRILGDGQPKYVNGPETELFSKRRTLYALDRAREAVRPRPGAEPAEVVAVEGYMDVIALHQAGFGAAVAPLGTALTAEQLEALWRLSPAPVLCFDGDGAGTRAAARAADVALPLLGTERSLSIATLPSGQDPDTLVRGGGPAAFRAVLAARTGLPAAIFALTRAQVGDGSEEQRARLAQALDDKAKLIPHAALSYEFRTTFRGLMNAQRQAARAKAFGAGGAGRPGTGGGRNGMGGGRAASPGAGPRLHAPFTEPDAAAERRRHLAAIMLYHPALVHDVEEAWCSLELPEAQARVRDTILSWSEHAEQLDSPALIAHLHSSGLGDEVARITSSQPLPLSAPALADAMPAEAEAAWWHYFGQLNLSELEREVEAAAVALRESLTEATSRRMITLKGALNRLRSGEQGEEPGL